VCCYGATGTGGGVELQWKVLRAGRPESGLLAAAVAGATAAGRRGARASRTTPVTRARTETHTDGRHNPYNMPRRRNENTKSR